MLQIFPGWFPADELLVAAAVFAIAVLTMNRGNKWVVNVLAQDEPLAVGIGVFVALFGPTIATPEWVWWVAGGSIAVYGLYAYVDPDVDIANLI